MRCLALAQAWQDAGGLCAFVSAVETANARRLVETEGIPLVMPVGEAGSENDAQALAAVAREKGARWVVVDGYQFDTQYQERIRAAGCKVLVLDDYAHAGRYAADLVLNQNPHSAENLYASREQHTALLLGTKYALLRREFRRWQAWERSVAPVADRLLVTTGGGDPGGASRRVVEALTDSGLQADIIAGAASNHADAGVGEVRGIRWHKAPPNMAELMANADMAVSGGGITLLELCFMQLPTIALVLAENQRPGAERLGEMGVTETLGDLGKITREQIARVIEKLRTDTARRTAMAAAGRELVDGQGAARVVMHLADRALRLRRALPSDCRLVWSWANEPEVRQASFNSDPIPWEAHVAWFGAKLRDANAIFYLAVNRDDLAVGQLRYDLHGKEAVVSVSLDRQFRGKGYGRMILDLGSEEIFCTTPVEAVNAYIKPENDSSVRAFVGAGYEKIGARKLKGVDALHFVLRRNRGAVA